MLLKIGPLHDCPSILLPRRNKPLPFPYLTIYNTHLYEHYYIILWVCLTRQCFQKKKEKKTLVDFLFKTFLVMYLLSA